ncbi:MAG: hypothetical protein PHZ26_05360 [Candidatus Gracilibacteria bacterium]|nr:hypothetical protein [Candidatus Gracilibacteria bacterium]MDD2909144.1 hypothetical protein [Candidatus Gracilibacteria bacterium]
MITKFNFNKSLTDLNKTISELSLLVKNDINDYDPYKTKELLELLYESSCNFGILKNKKFKFPNAKDRNLDKIKLKKVYAFINTFQKYDNLCSYSVLEIMTILDHSGELVYDDEYDNKIEILEEKVNIVLLVDFFQKTKEDIELYWNDSNYEYSLERMKLLKREERTKLNEPNIHNLGINLHDKLSFNEENGNLYFNKKMVCNISPRTRSFKLFLVLYTYIDKYVSYEKLRLFMGIGKISSIDSVYFSEIVTKEIPKKAQKFIKKELNGYILKSDI